MSLLFEDIFKCFEDMKEKTDEVAYSQKHAVCKHMSNKDCIHFKYD